MLNFEYFFKRIGDILFVMLRLIFYFYFQLKRAYAKFLDFFSKFMSGETTQQLSQTLSNIVEKYDKVCISVFQLFGL